MLKRYSLPVMRELWEEENKFKYWREVEIAVLAARVSKGKLSPEAYDAIKQYATFEVKRIEELEELYQHDMIAFVTTVQESLEKAGVGKYASEFHKCLTSYDVEDPALILMLRHAVMDILGEMRRLESALRKQAKEHQWTVMIARTHGQYAEPTTFGHLLLVFAEAVHRSIVRFESMLDRELGEGKISGAVGSFGGMNPVVAEDALQRLMLKPAKAETQILQRDRHAMLLSVIATAGGTIEQICRTFWEMMRSDVRELEEPRRAKQRGSSRMAYKKNPILTERLMGLPRLLRGHLVGHLVAGLENIATPECRDISQSSVERHILPDATSLLHYMAVKLTGLVENLVVFQARMCDNLHKMWDVWAGQPIRDALMEAGVSHDDAYLYIRRPDSRPRRKGGRC